MRVIFYYPAKMGGRASGSGVRPEKMLSALKARYDVEKFSGDRTARKQRIRKLKDEIKRGKRFGFLYFENLSVPGLISRWKLLLYEIFGGWISGSRAISSERCSFQPNSFKRIWRRIRGGLIPQITCV
jgi:hypothetical protein